MLVINNPKMILVNVTEIDAKTHFQAPCDHMNVDLQWAYCFKAINVNMD